MTPEDLIRTLKQALHDEREGLARLDCAAVARASMVKENAIQIILATPWSSREPFLAALAELGGELQRNLVMLSEARDALRRPASPVSA